MSDSDGISNADLRSRLEELGVNVGPITDSTRQLYLGKLAKLEAAAEPSSPKRGRGRPPSTSTTSSASASPSRRRSKVLDEDNERGETSWDEESGGSSSLYPDLSRDLNDLNNSPGRNGQLPTGHESSRRLSPEEAALFERRRVRLLNQTQSAYSNNLLYWIVGIVVALMAIFNWYKFALETDTMAEPENLEPVFSAAVHGRFMQSKRSIQTKFESQNGKIWATIGAAAMFLSPDRQHARQPSCVLLAGVPHETSCLARLTAEAFASATETDVLRLSPDKSLSALESAIERDWVSGRKHAMIIEGIDLLPFDVASSVLHALCDNDNAPRKKAVVIMTVKSDLSADECDEDAIERRLTDVWRVDSTEQQDNFSGLWSRISPQSICVQPETSPVEC